MDATQLHYPSNDEGDDVHGGHGDMAGYHCDMAGGHGDLVDDGAPTEANASLFRDDLVMPRPDR